MIVTLYHPGQQPQVVDSTGFLLPDEKGYARPTEPVATALGCSLGVVDIMDSGPDYVAYAIFDCEDEVNREATMAVKAISRYEYGAEVEENQLRGPVLIVQR